MFLAALGLFPLATAAAVSDMRSRRVSNRLNLLILIAGFGWRAATWMLAVHNQSGPWLMADALGGVAAGLVLLIVPFAMGWLGAGDVKLLAACGAWLGAYDTVLAGLIGLLGGGVIALAITMLSGAALRSDVARNLSASLATMTAPHAPRRAARFVVPLAVPIGAAACAILLARGLA